MSTQLARHSSTPRTGPRLAASVGLLLVVLAPPALLLVFVGSPVQLPESLTGTRALSGALDDAALLWLLASVVWLIWLHLLTCLLAEAVQIRRGRTVRVPFPRLLFGGNALLASHLIATLLLPVSAGSGLTPASVRTSYAIGLTTAAPASPATTMASEPRASHVEQSAASAFQLAEEPSLPECRVLPPHGRHHDTLWDIAERHLGDGTRWREIYALNEHRLMPDGQRLTRASLIRPGWVLRLPVDAQHMDVDAVRPAPQRVVQPAHEVGSVAPSQGERGATALAGERDETGGLTEERGPVAVRVDPHPVTGGTHETGAPERATDAVPDTAGSGNVERVVVGATLGTLSLSSLALLAALTRRRRVAGRRRPIGVRTARPAPELIATEAELRSRARRAQDVADTLRLALLVTAAHEPPLEVRAVWEHPDGSIELTFTDPALPPAPFTASERGWLLTREGQRYLFAVRGNGTGRRDRDTRLTDELHRAPDPCPLLLPVGEGDGSACLVNLEAFGLITVLADGAVDSSSAGTRLEDVLAAWAQGLAGAPWAEQAHIHVPESWAEIAVGHERLHARRLNEPGRPAPLSAVDREALAGSASLAIARHLDTGPARLLQPTLVLGHELGQLPADLVTAASDRLDPIVVLLTEPHPEAHVWQLAPDGTLTIPGVCDQIVPVTLDHDEQALQVRLLEHAQDPPHATSEASPVTTEHVHAAPRDTPTEPGPLDACSDADTPPSQDVASAGNAPAAEASIPDADADADAAQNTDAERNDPIDGLGRAIEVAVLGPLVVHGAAGTQPPRQQAMEMLVYLSLHRQPITLETLSEAIWPDRTYNARTVQNRLGDLRRYLGDGLIEKLPGNRYRLADLVVTDWQRFTHLADGNPDQQRAALALVRGTPFAQTHLDWYHLDGLHGEIEAAIVDLAVTVGQRALKASDFEAAKNAARCGLRGCPYDERLYRLGMQAAAAQGATAEVRQLRNQLAWILQEEIEPDDTLQPATEELYAELSQRVELTRYREGRRA